jgi:hypothetical protein
MSPPASPARNVNVACSACDGTRPCAQCAAAGKALAAAGHRVFHSSRYAALRAAADGTYGFEACVVPVGAAERAVADAVVALLGDAHVAIAVEDPSALPGALPAHFSSFPLGDFRRGALPPEWLAGLSSARRPTVDAQRPTDGATPAANGTVRAPSAKSQATRRLRSIVHPFNAPVVDAAALVEDELAWYRASDLGFVLLSVKSEGHAGEALCAALGPLLRTSDSTATRADDCIVVLAGADAQQGKRVATRLAAPLAKHLGVARDAVRIGAAACPDDGADAEALLALATKRASV